MNGTTATELAAAAASRDPRVGLGAVAALRRLLDSLESLQVGNARDQGWSWQQIAAVLGVSKQAVHKKHAAGRQFGGAVTMFERFTSGARQAVTDAQGEARRLGHRYIGTEHLLLGLLVGGDGIAAAVLRDAGIDASTVEGDVVRIVGRGPGSEAGFDAAAGADADALRILGIDLDAVREAAEAAFGPGALDWASVAVSRPARRRRLARGLRPFAGRRRSCRADQPHGDRPPTFSGHIPFTPRAKKVLELSLREALALRHHYIGTEHILLGLIREGEGLAAEALVLHGVGLTDLRRRVLTALGNAA